MDTIFAKSSGFGVSAISIFRISGTKTLEILKILTKNIDVDHLIPRHIYLKNIYDPVEDFIIDNALVIFFKSPKSYTGEDMLEIHTHGSVAIEKIIFNTLNKIIDVRIADSGEFTKRAFLNNKLDLIKVEAISDLIESDTKEQHKQAINQISGNLSKLYSKWRDILISLIFKIEALIDFPEEEISNHIKDEISFTLTNFKNLLTKHLSTANQGEIIKNGIKLCFVGPPNSGKSSLMNFLLEREVSIISNIAGTTRDVIEAKLDIKGYPVILYDTAGIHSHPTDIVEKKGIAKSLELIKICHIKVFLIEYGDINNLQFFKSIIQEPNTIFLISKQDVLRTKNLKFDEQIVDYGKNFLEISVKTKFNIEKLMNLIVNQVSQIIDFEPGPKITSERHKLEIEKALYEISQISAEDDLVIVAEKIRISKNYLGNIIGEITTEDVLEKIFCNFCIGK